MKRKFSFAKNTAVRYILKWMAAFGISAAGVVILILLLTPVQKKMRWDMPYLQTAALILLALMSGSTAYIFVRLTRCKGIVGGGVSAVILGALKLCFSALGAGIHGKNGWSLITIFAAALAGGILSANRKNKTEKKIGILHKFRKR